MTKVKFTLAEKNKELNEIFESLWIAQGYGRPNLIGLMLEGKTPEQSRAELDAWDKENDRKLKESLERLEKLKTKNRPGKKRRRHQNAD